MATSKNFLLHQMSGQLAKQLVIKQYGDKTVISKYPDMSRRKLSPKQKRVNDTMEAANYEAKGIMADATLKAAAQVRLNVTSNKLYQALIREYFQQAAEEMKTTEAGKK